MNNNQLILVGAGGFGREVLAWAEKSFPEIDSFPVIGFLDDNVKTLSGCGRNIPWLGSIAEYVPESNDLFLLAIANPSAKEKVVQVLKSKGGKFASLIHPTSIVVGSVLGEGVIICPFTLISVNTFVGDFVTINAFSNVGHDSIVGDFSTLSGHVDITGQITVGKNVFFGTGAKLLPRISIGEGCVIGAGSTVFRSVGAGVTVFTAPAKKLNFIADAEERKND